MSGAEDQPPSTPRQEGAETDSMVPMARPLVAPAGESAVRLEVGDPMLLPGRTRRGAVADILVFLLIVFGLLVLGEIALGAIYGGPGGSSEEGGEPAPRAIIRDAVPVQLTIMAVASVGTIAVILRRRGEGVRSIGLSTERLWTNGWIGLGTLVGTGVLVIVVSLVLGLLIPQWRDMVAENTERIKETVPNVGPAGFVALTSLVGIYEEVTVRGFVMTRLRRAMGSWTAAVLISTIGFVLLHAPTQTASALVAVSVLSLAFSAVTIWRRSIVPAIVAHILFDLSQLLYLYALQGENWT